MLPKDASETDDPNADAATGEAATFDDGRALSIEGDDEPAGSPEAFSPADDEAGPPDDSAPPEIADSPDTSPRDPRSGETP